MKRVKLAVLAAAAASALTIAGARVDAGVFYPDPGWAYTYDGSTAAYGGAGAVADNAGAGRAALDGNWTHDNGSDTWSDNPNGSNIGDRLGAGVGLAGGVDTLTEADAASPGGVVRFLRQVDASTAASPAEMRRTYFMRGLETVPGYTPTFMDTGVTISFRARLTPDAALEGALTSANKGGTVGGDGKGMFGFRQNTGGKIVTFSLHTASPGEDGGPAPAFAGAGLTLNKNVGDAAPSGSVGNGSSTAVAQNDLLLDPNVWHEFWITVAANDATVGNGTHTATIYMDGSLTGTSFNFTAGTGSDTGTLPVGSTRMVCFDPPSSIPSLPVTYAS